MSLKSVLAQRLDAQDGVDDPLTITTEFLEKSLCTDEDLHGMLDVLLSRPQKITASKAMMIFINFAPNSREFDTPLLVLFFRFIMDDRVQREHVAHVLREAEKKRVPWHKRLLEIREKGFGIAWL